MDHTNGTRVLVRFILVWSEGSWIGEGERENFWNSVRKGRGFDRILKEKEKRIYFWNGNVGLWSLMDSYDGREDGRFINLLYSFLFASSRNFESL